MSLNSTPMANRIHIGFFGCTNAGKSSVVNAICDQELAVVSNVKGTTTDPVTKSMEILPLGPVVIIDTAGLDDNSELGEKRIAKTMQVLDKTDIAVLVVDATVGMNEFDKKLIETVKSKNIPYLIVYNKCELNDNIIVDENSILVSAVTKKNIFDLKERLGKLMKENETEKCLVKDLLNSGDFVILVTPIDESAPKGRMILPQVQMIRDILDANAVPVVTKETELKKCLDELKNKPKMVITDSQAFDYVSKVVPNDIPLTSFSILMARYKGFLETAIKGIESIKTLKDGDTVLIAEGCTHHRQCNDIGTVKIPKWLKNSTNKNINIKTCSGTEFPQDLSEYAAVIHCGGCMLNEKEVLSRMNRAVSQGVPFVNYGIFIANATGILKRSIEIFNL